MGEAAAGVPGAKATCACWIGAQGNCFAVGYSSSDICVFGLPQPVQQGKELQLTPQASHCQTGFVTAQLCYSILLNKLRQCICGLCDCNLGIMTWQM